MIATKKKSWSLLWWGVISFQNFRMLKLGLYFCVDFLASSELIGHRSRFDGFLWNLAKMFPCYQCTKVCEAFLICQILFLLRALMWRRSANIRFANFKIDFLGNQSEYRKASHAFVVYHLLIGTVQFVWSYVPAGRQVIQFSKYLITWNFRDTLISRISRFKKIREI